MIGFKVEENVTDYFNKLVELTEKEKPELLNTLVRTMVGIPNDETGGYIAPNMSQWNPYLFSSGQNAIYWHGTLSPTISQLYALYTGRDIHKFVKKPKIWWEFAKENNAEELSSRERTLGRDYAYFQETGKDKIAKSNKAQNQYAIREGIKDSAPELLEETTDYVSKLIQLKKGKHTLTGTIHPVSKMFTHI